MGHRIGIGDFEAPFLQVIAVIEEGAADKERAFWIDHDANIGRLHQNVAIGRPVDEVHFVLQPGTTPANHCDPQCAHRASLFLQERIQFSRGVLGHLDETLVADLVIDGDSWKRRVGHEERLVVGSVTASKPKYMTLTSVLSLRERERAA